MLAKKQELCLVCKKIGKVTLCKGCRQRHYCSFVCQRQDWKIHKKACLEHQKRSESRVFGALFSTSQEKKSDNAVFHRLFSQTLHKYLTNRNPKKVESFLEKLKTGWAKHQLVEVFFDLPHQLPTTKKMQKQLTKAMARYLFDKVMKCDFKEFKQVKTQEEKVNEVTSLVFGVVVCLPRKDKRIRTALNDLNAHDVIVVRSRQGCFSFIHFIVLSNE